MSEIRAMDDDIHSGVLHNESGEGDGDEPVAPDLKSNKADGQTPGEMLREARLALSYSVADLCAQTMLSQRTVEALEDNRFEQLSQPVFARGYYRKCAKVLGMDTDALMSAYAASGGAQTATAVDAIATPVHIVPADVTPDRRRTFGTIFLVLILLIAAFAVYLFWAASRDAAVTGGNNSGGIELASEFIVPDSQSEQTVAPSLAAAMSNNAAAEQAAEQAARSTAEDAAPVAADAGPSADEAGAASPADGNTQATAGDTATVDAATVTVDDGTDSQQASAASVPTAGTALTLEFSGRSWVDVRDATGQQLLVGIYESTTRTLDGVPPYELVIGYAPGVQVRLGGEPVEVNPEGNNTARFSVGKDDS